MEKIGTFTVFIHCLTMQGFDIVPGRKPIAVKRGITKAKAETAMREHNRLAVLEGTQSQYYYQWQEEPEILDPHAQR